MNLSANATQNNVSFTGTARQHTTNNYINIIGFTYEIDESLLPSLVKKNQKEVIFANMTTSTEISLNYQLSKVFDINNDLVDVSSVDTVHFYAWLSDASSVPVIPIQALNSVDVSEAVGTNTNIYTKLAVNNITTQDLHFTGTLFNSNTTIDTIKEYHILIVDVNTFFNNGTNSAESISTFVESALTAQSSYVYSNTNLSIARYDVHDIDTSGGVSMLTAFTDIADVSAVSQLYASQYQAVLLCVGVDSENVEKKDIFVLSVDKTAHGVEDSVSYTLNYETNRLDLSANFLSSTAVNLMASNYTYPKETYDAAFYSEGTNIGYVTTTSTIAHEFATVTDVMGDQVEIKSVNNVHSYLWFEDVTDSSIRSPVIPPERVHLVNMSSVVLDAEAVSDLTQMSVTATFSIRPPISTKPSLCYSEPTNSRTKPRRYQDVHYNNTDTMRLPSLRPIFAIRRVYHQYTTHRSSDGVLHRGRTNRGAGIRCGLHTRHVNCRRERIVRRVHVRKHRVGRRQSYRRFDHSAQRDCHKQRTVGHQRGAHSVQQRRCVGLLLSCHDLLRVRGVCPWYNTILVSVDSNNKYVFTPEVTSFWKATRTFSTTLRTVRIR